MADQSRFSHGSVQCPTTPSGVESSESQGVGDSAGPVGRQPAMELRNVLTRVLRLNDRKRGSCISSTQRLGTTTCLKKDLTKHAMTLENKFHCRWIYHLTRRPLPCKEISWNPCNPIPMLKRFFLKETPQRKKITRRVAIIKRQEPNFEIGAGVLSHLQRQGLLKFFSSGL